ncbi:hypothetical protein ACOMHN_040996 [Nucella lapillus]
MRPDLRPSRSSELVPFQSCCVKTLDDCEFTNTHSAVSEDGSLTWVHKGAVLEVVSTGTGHRVASLDAQHLLRDEEAAVTCVCEFSCQGRQRLVAALKGSAEQGVVVLLDVASSLIVKAVEIPQQVTAVDKVLTYGGANVPSWALSEQLRQFYGIVAVGTEGGYVYLVDLALDCTYSFDTSQKVVPCALRLLEPRERDVQGVRQQAFRVAQHLGLRLGVDEQSHTNDCFHFRGPDLAVRQSFNEDEVYVSCLKYIPQCGTLAIGYNFGGFHLWKLFNPVIEFASIVEAEDLPVAFFVYQEPENDPKNFAYLWVCRDDRLSEQKQESICSMVLYQLSYSRRTFYTNYGNFFEELNLLTLRLEHHLTVEPYNNRNATTWSSQLMSASVVTDPNYRPPDRLAINDSFDEGSQGPDLSLCLFVWEAQDSRPGSRNEVFLAVFDMNRWYHAQMPSRIKCVNVGGQEVCPFLAVYRMSDAVYKEGCDSLVNIQIKPGSLLRFVNNSPMPPEQHFYPSSLAFDTVCVLSNGIVSASILGVQRTVLSSLESSGPSCLLKPFDLYHRCLQTGLMARSSDPSSSALSVDEQQRMSLLTLALEQGKIRFITSCISSWADGDFIQLGCTLQFLLSWAWSRVTAIKQQIDITCQPLFDWSETPVDQRMLQILQNSLCCLGHLRTVLHTLLTQASPVSDQGQVELEHRIRVVTLLQCHLKVMLWFVHSGLLPEHEEKGKASTSHYIYPASELSQVFAGRRQQMVLSPSSASTHEMILIDALVHSAGDPLSQLWKNEEGTGMYPPPSLHAALSMYLLDGVEDRTKSAIMLYLLFDMAAVAHGQQEEFAEKIPRFARAFDFPLGLVQQIHGFWLIDHMNFQEGLNQLRLRSGQDLGPWQHACILRALMHQGEAASALHYLSMRNPPVLTAHDLQMRLTILIANRLVNQAVMLVRTGCGPGDQDLMLKHIFTQCQQRKLMNVLLKLPLNDKEEKCLQNYLSENTDSAAAELLVLHLLQRAQYVPAIRLNDRMKHRATMDLSSKTRERSKTRNSIVDGFRQSLPATQQYLINNPTPLARLPHTRKIEVPRPKPLSTVVTQRAERRANCQSAMILAVMDKVAEAGRLLAEEEGFDDEEERGGRMREPVVVHKPGPFLCTPTTPRLQARLRQSSQVAFPNIQEVTQALLSSVAFTSPSSPSAIRHSQRFTADCMSLLQTPKIDHTPARVASPARRTTTPHSILKVSCLSHTSPRLKGVGKSSRGQPKRLGFSTSMSSSPPPLSSTPTSLTPSSTPSPTSAVEAMAFKATAAVEQSKPEKSMSEMVTPKQIRFAEPETREISPAYVSPDSLARPPLRSPDEDSIAAEDQDCLQQESTSEEVMAESDEEITFNMSRQVADPMETDKDGDSSTLPITTSSPSAAATPHTRPLLLSPSVEQILTQSREENLQGVQSRLKEREQNIAPESSPRLTRGCVREGVSESEVTSTSSVRDRSPLTVRTGTDTDSLSPHRRLSPQGSPPSLLTSTLHQQETVTQTSVVKETKHTSLVSERFAGSYNIVSEERVQSAKETTVLVVKAPSQQALPIIECDKESETVPPQSAEAMETIEPAEDNLLIEARQAVAVQENMVEEPEPADTVEVAADDEEGVLDLEVQVPTPIRRSSRRNTPERSTRSLRTSRRTGLKIDLTAVEKDEEKLEPTPPKLRRMSPSRETATEDEEWPESMPRLQLEVSDEENSNDNYSKWSPQAPHSGRKPASPAPSLSPTQKSGSAKPRESPFRRLARASTDRSPPVSPSRGSDKSPSVSPSQKATGSVRKSRPDPLKPVDRSPPVSPSRRATRSVDRSPPVSPSRRSTRSVDRSPPVSLSRRSTRSMDRSPPPSPSRTVGQKDEKRGRGAERVLSAVTATTTQEVLMVQTESAEVMPLPVSPSRRSTRLRTPERSPGRKGRTPERGTKDTVTPSSDGESTEPPKKKDAGSSRSPGRHSTRRAKSPPSSQQPDKAEQSETTCGKSEEGKKDTDTPHSPSRRSTKHSKTSSPERLDNVQQSESASEKETLEKTDSDTPSSPGRRSTRRAKTPDAGAVPEPVSPSRGKGKWTKASEKSSESSTASPSRSRRHEGVVGLEASPTSTEMSASEEPASSSSPSRRSSRGRSKTPERSTVRVATRLREKVKVDEGESIMEEVKDIAMATEEVRSQRRQQRDVSPRAAVHGSSVAQETGDAPSFQFAPPTLLSGVQTDSMLAPPSDVSAYIFSPPITCSTRSQRGSTSSTNTSKSTRSRTKKDSVSLHEESIDLVPEMEQSEGEEKPAGSTRKKSTAKGRRKTRTKSVVPTASPSDSPINLVSPGQPASSEKQLDTAKGAGRKTQPAGATRSRILRKRQAKLCATDRRPDKFNVLGQFVKAEAECTTLGNSLQEATTLGNSLQVGTTLGNSLLEGTILGNSLQEGTTLGNSPQEGTTLVNSSQEGTTMGNSPQEGTTMGNFPQEGTTLGNSSQEGTTLGNSSQEGTTLGNSPQEALPWGTPHRRALPWGTPHRRALPWGTPHRRALPWGTPHRGHYPGELPSGGHYPGELPSGGHYPGELLTGGHYPGELLTGGHYPGELPTGGHYPGELLTGGHYPGELLLGGHYPGELPSGGYYPGELPSGGHYPGELPSGGHYPGELPSGGHYPGELPSGGHYPGELPSGGHYPGELLTGGHYPGELPTGGHYPGELSSGGHYPGELLSGGHYPGELLSGGHYPGELPSGGHYPGELLTGGHYPGELPLGGHYPGRSVLESCKKKTVISHAPRLQRRDSEALQTSFHAGTLSAEATEQSDTHLKVDPPQRSLK